MARLFLPLLWLDRALCHRWAWLCNWAWDVDVALTPPGKIAHEDYVPWPD